MNKKNIYVPIKLLIFYRNSRKTKTALSSCTTLKKWTSNQFS